MIKIQQPAMVLTSHDAPPPYYRMTNNWSVGPDVTPQHMLGWAAVVFKDFRTKWPNNRSTLIFNCHGKESDDCVGGFGLQIGTGITSQAHLEHFSKLQGLVDEIVLVVCKAAQHVVGRADGDRFVATIAQRAAAKVTASTSDQVRGPGDPAVMPFGHIDDLDGDILVYDREGSVVGYRFR